MNPTAGASMEKKPAAGTAARAGLWDSVGRIVLALAAVAAYARLFFGVDTADESFYNATARWFASGGRPYHDELNLTQNGALLLAPIFKLYHAIVGSSTGLVLFNRHLFFALLAGCSYLAWRVATAHVDRRFARFLAAFTLTFSYFNIPSLSYNTFGTFFLFDGLFLLLLYSAPTRQEGGAGLIFAANTFFVGAAFAHASFVAPAVAGFLGALLLALRARPADGPAQRRKLRAAWAGSVALGAVAAVVFVGGVGLDGIRESLAYAGSYGIDLSKFAGTWARWNWEQLSWLLIDFLPGFAALLILPILPGRSFRGWRTTFPFLVAVLSAGIVYLAHRNPNLGQHYPAGSAPVLLSLALLLPLLLWFLPDRRRALEIALLVALPCWLAMVAISFTSTNGFVSATIGAFPAAVCAVLVVGMVAAAIDRDGTSNQARAVSVMAGLVPLIMLQCVSLLERSYRDAPFRFGPPVFASGPFAGILTNEHEANGLAAVAADLKTYGSTAHTLFVFDEFPAGYLLSPLQPRTFSTWIFWPRDPEVAKRFIARVFDAAEPPPDVVLRVAPATLLVNPELKRLGYKIRVVRPEFAYMILTRDPGPKTP